MRNFWSRWLLALALVLQPAIFPTVPIPAPSVAQASQLFVAASTQALTGSGVVTVLPFTISLWIYANTLPNNAIPFSIDSASDLGAWIQFTTAANKLTLFANGGISGATTNAALSTGVWYHVVGVWTSQTSRSIYLDGDKVTNSMDAGALGTFTVSAIGCFIQSPSTTNFHWDGLIAHVGIWSAALTDAEVNSLLKGFSPMLIRPQSLSVYSPLIGNINSVRGSAWTNLNGSTASSANPRIYYAR